MIFLPFVAKRPLWITSVDNFSRFQTGTLPRMKLLKTDFREVVNPIQPAAIIHSLSAFPVDATPIFAGQNARLWISRNLSTAFSQRLHKGNNTYLL